MREYIAKEAIPSALAGADFLKYPHLATNTEAYLQDYRWEERLTESGDTTFYIRPNNLFIESLHHIGEEPKTILDIGCETGRHSLLLAELGHKVVALDRDPRALEQAREAARTRGIPAANFTPRVGNLEDLGGDESYEVVLAMMVLHYLEPRGIPAATAIAASATRRGGLLVANAYTDDNPTQEKEGRALRYLFKPGELGRLCSAQGLTALHYAEGPLKQLLQRSVNGQVRFLLPSVAEVIARKPV